jgi:hypothetical protein
MSRQCCSVICICTSFCEQGCRHTEIELHAVPATVNLLKLQEWSGVLLSLLHLALPGACMFSKLAAVQ